MIRLSASLSRKLPVPTIEFSSQSASAGLEVEVSNAADGEEIASKLKNMYALLDRSITEQLSAASAGPPQRPFLSEANGGCNGDSRNGNSSGRNGRRNDGHASIAQVKAVFAISKDKGMSRDELVQLLQGEFGLDKPDDLTMRQASDLIGQLQKLQTVRR